jgi:hypothetical protein
MTQRSTAVSKRDQTPPTLRLPGFEPEEETQLPSGVSVTFLDPPATHPDYADRDRRSAHPTRWEAAESARPAFPGPAYVQEFDYERLSKQLRAVYLVMKDGRKRTIGEVVEAVGGGSETGVAAAIRALRQKRNGSHRIEKQRRGDPKSGLWEYWLVK